MRRAFPAIMATMLAATPVAAQDIAIATVRDTKGIELGEVTVENTPSGIVHLTATLTGLPAGTHGFHLHETGDCSAGDFASAGGHIGDGWAHGIMEPEGLHPGDLPNVTVPESGDVVIELFLDTLDLETMIFDADGASIIVHDVADDYTSQPSGNSGDRVACGEFGSSV